MDPDNPVVKLCAEGMQAEFDGKPDLARSLFYRAWDTAQDDYEASIAAHFVARHQGSPEESLHWNKESLTRAEAVGDDRVAGFFPSLYLNMGYSYETLGNLEEALRYYDLAESQIDVLSEGRYGDTTRGAIAAGKTRIAAATA